MTASTDLDAVQRVVGAALASLEASRMRIDDLNVYPVPDGDTGTNLTMTVRAVADAVEESHASDRRSLARDVARGALMGARGNSGVIFSQIVRGAADVLAETTNGVDPRGRSACAARRHRRGVPRRRRPVEGTMLSVIRELAEEAESRTNGGDAARRPAGRARPPRRGGGRANAGAARRPARGRRGGRGRGRAARARARRRLGRERRGRARGAAGGRAHERGGDPPGAVALPLLHRLPDRGRRSRPRAAGGAARAAGRLAARRRRRERVEGARPHGPSRRGAVARHRRRDDRPHRDRQHARADAAARGAAARVRARRRTRRHRHRRRRRGRREPAAVREPRRERPDPDRRGRPDDEPVHRRPAGGAAVARRRRGDPAPEQLQRPPRRGAGSAPFRPSGRGGAVGLDPGRPRRDARLRRRPRPPATTRPRCGSRSRRSRPAR